MSLTETTIDLGGVELGDNQFTDGVVVFGAAGTKAAGTILARDSVSNKFVPFVIGGTTNENGIPKAVLVNDVTADAAGDEPARPCISGRVNADRLIVDADGDGSNLTPAILDQLRGYSIVAIPVSDLSVLDN